MSEGMAGPGAVGVAAEQAGVPRALAADACSSVLTLPEANPVTRDSSMPGLWHDWLLDQKQIYDHCQRPIMMSNQDEDVLSYTINLKGREGA